MCLQKLEGEKGHCKSSFYVERENECSDIRTVIQHVYDKKQRKNLQMNVINWTNFGKALAQSIADYCSVIEGKTDIVQTLRAFMPEEFIETELEVYMPKTNKS
jgi:hypothetical protein